MATMMSIPFFINGVYSLTSSSDEIKQHLIISVLEAHLNKIKEKVHLLLVKFNLINKNINKWNLEYLKMNSLIIN